jgi:NADH/NAD ratio-sensing transcriptional regulator Rex
VPLSGSPWSIAPWGTCAALLLNGANVKDSVDQAERDFVADANRIVSAAAPDKYAQAVLDSLVQRGVGAALDFEGDGGATL